MLLMVKGYRLKDLNWFRFGIEALQNCEWKTEFIE
ncbi:MAG: hypothetical protein ACD_34C00648G0002 [uncultured bacterium]|nr:MAG: hypothetical protein ACD_34C00648G0002 [uncultured bacterium]